MSAEVRGADDCEVSVEAAAAELARLLADNRFRVSDRQREILNYLAGRRLAGCREGVKAYSIALDVLGRPSGFDATNDPIVRIEISRLRTTLDAYYALFAEELGVSIHIPKGVYVTYFPRQHIEHEAEDETIPEDADRGEASPPAPNTTIALAPRIRPLLPYVLTAALVMIIAAGMWAIAREPALTHKPVLAVSMTAASPDMQGEASLTRDMLLTALTGFQTVIVRRQEPDRAADGHGYDIELKLYGDRDDRMIWWQVVDAETGDLLKSGVEKAELDGRSLPVVREALAGSLARQIASSRGIVNMLDIKYWSVGAPGSVCVLRAEHALDNGETERLSAARACLERTLALVPGDPDAEALLSRVLLSPRGEADDEDIERSLQLARSAVAAAPLSDRAHQALMSAQFAAGRGQAAIQAGNRALALNPNNFDAAAALALVLSFSGYAKAGADLARDALAKSDTPPADALLVLSLEAYRADEWAQASLLAEQTNSSDFLVSVLKAASLGELGSPDAAAKLAAIKGDDARFEENFRRRLAVTGVGAEVFAQLATGLIKAGAKFDTVASIQP